MIWKAQIRWLFGNSHTPHIEMSAKQIMTPWNLIKIPWKPKESRLETWFYTHKMTIFVAWKHLIPDPINKIPSRNRCEPQKRIFWTEIFSFGFGGVSNWRESFKGPAHLILHLIVFFDKKNNGAFHTRSPSSRDGFW